MSTEAPWWRGAVIYQIYPRSFMDANGDGTGDLVGITDQLDYIKDLGVDALWISPFFKSPQADYGYDVEDYCGVDPLFGTLEDADILIERAHARGLKVMVDLVLSHTSDRHPWFRESRQNRTNPKANWYVWADPAPDGTAPNNWLSVFGGTAWEYEPRRGQYYLHNFLKQQPDLNLHEPAVVEALLEIAEFWLDRGVDGFRLDAIDFAVHDPQLRNNPIRPSGEAVPGGLVSGTPYARQLQHMNKGLAELLPILLRPLRRLCDRYGDVPLLGELSGDHALSNAARYSDDGRGMHMAYTFDLLASPYTPEGIGRVVDELERRIGGGWPAWSFSNHDVVRAPTRFGGLHPPEGLRRQLPVLLTCLRGTVCLYQGDELGLDEAELAFEDLHDPYGVTFWPVFKGRDGCRTPMPWTDAPGAGFTTAKPWLPIPPGHRARSVADQVDDPASCLVQVRDFLAWRRHQPALVRGDWRRHAAPDGILAFERHVPEQHLFLAFNLTGEKQRWMPPLELTALEPPLAVPGALSADGTLSLPGHGCLIASLGDERE
ncbi:MAG: alpha-glucosidase [Geminicoccaceae bacterium]|nr:MAG: alpha-glucosidase [Geminicoccaceae bacterium]